MSGRRRSSDAGSPSAIAGIASGKGAGVEGSVVRAVGLLPRQHSDAINGMLNRSFEWRYVESVR